MQGVLVAAHLLAATVWAGRSVALVFVGVPAIRRSRASRARLERRIGRRSSSTTRGSQREICEQGTQKTRPTLVVLGSTSLALMLIVPLLGVALAPLGTLAQRSGLWPAPSTRAA